MYRSQNVPKYIKKEGIGRENILRCIGNENNGMEWVMAVARLMVAKVDG
jgi:hypothetical protein